MVSVDGLTVEFGGTPLFKDISFVINEKDRIALMGKNGAGKSTLLKILAGQRTATRGTVSAPRGTVVAYLPQHLMTEDGRTVFEEASQAFAHLHEMEARIGEMNRELTERTDYESDSYMALIEEVATLSEKFYAIDLTHFEEDVEKTLLGLGFRRSDFGRQTSEFSGGWRMRIELAKMLLRNPDVLLLDEPTNHLDIESIGWLEDFIVQNGMAVVVISHDRKFIDNITTRTIEVTMGRIYDYKVNYSQYLQLRAERRGQQLRQYEEQQKMIAEAKEFIERFKGTYSKTFQVQSRVKMARETRTGGGGRGGHLGPAPEVSALAAQRAVSRHHGGCGQGFRRKAGAGRRVAHGEARRQGGLRRAQRRGQVDAGEVYHAGAGPRGRTHAGTQRAHRLFRPEPGLAARRRTDGVPDD